MINDDLSWSPKVEYVTGKANTVFGLLRRTFKEWPHELREIGYFSMVRSILEYASAVWDLRLKGHTTNGPGTKKSHNICQQLLQDLHQRRTSL